MRRLRKLDGSMVLIALVAVLALSFVIAIGDANEGSAERSVATCKRGNPGRAYLLLRAGEFTRTPFRQRSYTTDISPIVWELLNCEATVANGGNPVPLSSASQRAYLRSFKARRVPITDGDRLVGSVPFAAYFDRR